jgi:hypothetical protein
MATDGLYIARKLVEYGGDHGKAVPEGAVLYFALPQLSPGSAVKCGKGGMRSGRLLIIEDDATLNWLLAVTCGR